MSRKYISSTCSHIADQQEALNLLATFAEYDTKPPPPPVEEKVAACSFAVVEKSLLIEKIGTGSFYIFETKLGGNDVEKLLGDMFSDPDQLSLSMRMNAFSMWCLKVKYPTVPDVFVKEILRITYSAPQLALAFECKATLVELSESKQISWLPGCKELEEVLIWFGADTNRTASIFNDGNESQHDSTPSQQNPKPVSVSPTSALMAHTCMLFQNWVDTVVHLYTKQLEYITVDRIDNGAVNVGDFIKMIDVFLMLSGDLHRMAAKQVDILPLFRAARECSHILIHFYCTLSQLCIDQTLPLPTSRILKLPGILDSQLGVVANCLPVRPFDGFPLNVSTDVSNPTDSSSTTESAIVGEGSKVNVFTFTLAFVDECLSTHIAPAFQLYLKKDANEDYDDLSDDSETDGDSSVAVAVFWDPTLPHTVDRLLTSIPLLLDMFSSAKIAAISHDSSISMRKRLEGSAEVDRRLTKLAVFLGFVVNFLTVQCCELSGREEVKALDIPLDNDVCEEDPAPNTGQIMDKFGRLFSLLAQFGSLPIIKKRPSTETLEIEAQLFLIKQLQENAFACI